MRSGQEACPVHPVAKPFGRMGSGSTSCCLRGQFFEQPGVLMPILWINLPADLGTNGTRSSCSYRARTCGGKEDAAVSCVIVRQNLGGSTGSDSKSQASQHVIFCFISFIAAVDGRHEMYVVVRCTQLSRKVEASVWRLIAGQAWEEAPEASIRYTAERQLQSSGLTTSGDDDQDVPTKDFERHSLDQEQVGVWPAAQSLTQARPLLLKRHFSNL
ncbi:uncharacterized protein [Dermacentor albipictus]|uniref:uncharacterized protein n=1 Tax=Dermacentor albipictus TaxID=60249 RepID=UPI0031FD2AD6